MSKSLKYTLTFLGLLLLTITIAKLLENGTATNSLDPIPKPFLKEKNTPKKYITINDTVCIADYFDFMDSLVATYNRVNPYRLTEHIIVNSNSWIKDSLANTDYYSMMQRDSFVYDQQKMIVLRPKDSLYIPDSLASRSISEHFDKVRIDINLPEFKLRVYNDSLLVSTYPIRIGQNTSKYLKMGDRLTDLRTKQGKGKIIEYRKNPDFYNPTTGKQYFTTRRDDGKTTLMPQIPWMVTEINGIQNGQLIHPTTNPKSLGKAYSNGCIGVKESDAWLIYYQCPIGTEINIRYDLKVKDGNGFDIILEDVYNKGV